MRDHVTRRPIPVEQSILWKPLHDPHYVVASLQPNDGGRRKIFVRQQALALIEALLHAHKRHAFGLLLGQFYHCPVTNSEYLIIESVSEHLPARDEADMAAGIGEALASRTADQRARVMGWFRGAPAVDARPSPTTAATHSSLLTQPWQTTFVIAESGSSGAFFLRDSVNARWFSSPFYELLEHAPAADQPKPSIVDWPQHYITIDRIVPADRSRIPKLELADVRPKSGYDRPTLAPLAGREVEPKPAAIKEPAAIPLMAATPETPIPIVASPVAPRLADSSPTATDRPATQPVQEGLADVAQPTRERGFSRRGQRSGEKLSIVDDRDQRTALANRRITDADDTGAADDPSRYIELARMEGFFIAAKFDMVSGLGPLETLWVLNEPFSGMLLAVVTTHSEVVDATLHYNMQTDEAGLRRVPFPEHRHEESKTIYVRETCIDSLRARCRRLRATNALLRDWKVTPKIALVTPTEWEALPALSASGTRGLTGIGELSDARIAELPSGVRTQFHLGAPVDEASA